RSGRRPSRRGRPGSWRPSGPRSVGRARSPWRRSGSCPLLLLDGVERLTTGQPWPTGVLPGLPFGGCRGVRLPEILGGRADTVGDRVQRREVEVVERGLVEPEDRRRLVNGDVPEAVLEELARVGPGALRVREVVAPHDVADADLVTPAQFPPPRVGRADGAVAVEVLAREHRE